jgi:hemolysin III
VHHESGNAVEEIFNSLTHAIGAGLSIAGLVALLFITTLEPDPWKFVSFSVYGATQIMLFLSSAVLHSFATMPRIRYYLRIIDQAFVFVLIAGTYTPLALVAMRDNWGWTLFGVIWGLAVLGILLKVFIPRGGVLTDLVYVPMGWLVLLFFRPFLESTSAGFALWALIGGACYTLGVAFYAWKRLPFSHTVWHLFVIAGSLSFFMAYAAHLAPA